MDLKERTPTNILIWYVVTTLVLWGLALGALGGIFWLGAVRENSVAETIIPYLIMLVIFSPILIPDKSARVALNNQRILPSDNHLSRLSVRIAIVNVILYSLPFIIVRFFIDDYYLLWSIALLIVNIAAFLSSFWKFRPKKTKMSSKVETAQNDLFKKDEEGNIIDINAEQLPNFKLYPNKAAVKKSYDSVSAAIFGIIFLGLIIGALLDLTSIFLMILLLAPITAFGIFYYRMNYYNFKRNPHPFEIEHGYELTKMVFKANLISFFIVTGFALLIVFYGASDRNICINTRFWLRIGLILLFFIVSFLPLFTISHMYFKKLEADAYDAERIAEESPFSSKRLKLKGKKTDETLTAFITEIGLGNMDYLIGWEIRNLNIDHLNPVGRVPPTTIMVFNDTEVHLFLLVSSRITHILTFPTAVITILRTLEHKNERRVEFLVGNTMRILFIVQVNKKGLNHQEEMFKRFIDLARKDDIVDEYERFIQY